MFDPLEILLEMEAEITDNMTRLLAKGALPSAEWQAEKIKSGKATVDLGGLFGAGK